MTTDNVQILKLTRAFGSGELKRHMIYRLQKKIILFIITTKELFKKHKIQVKNENDFFSATQSHAENECICVPVTTILSIALVFRHIHWGMSMFRSDRL